MEDKMVEISAPLIGYPGGKHTISKKLINEFPKEYNKYCEIFVGGGSVYFRENKAKERVINDKSKELIDFYKKFSKTSCSAVRKCEMDLSQEQKRNACQNRKKSVCSYLQSSKMSFTGFCENGFSNTKKRKMSKVKKNCEIYQEKLRSTKILNQDWKTVADKHCTGSKDVCFLDPPYVKKSFKYREEGVTPKEVCEWANTAKAKVLITYDDRPEVKRACDLKNLHIKKLPIKYSLTTGQLGHQKRVNELLIKNF